MTETICDPAAEALQVPLAFDGDAKMWADLTYFATHCERFMAQRGKGYQARICSEAAFALVARHRRGRHEPRWSS